MTIESHLSGNLNLMALPRRGPVASFMSEEETVSTFPSFFPA